MIKTTPTQLNGQPAMTVKGLPADGEPMTLADWRELARHIVYATHDAQMMPDHPMTPNVWMPAEKFCDINCSWTNHHPDCLFSGVK